MSTFGYSKAQFNEMTGGFHPAELCGEDCAGCFYEPLGTIPVSGLDRLAYAQLFEGIGEDGGTAG